MVLKDHHWTLLANYCSVSNLLFLSKVVEKAKAQQAFLEDASILNPFQSSGTPTRRQAVAAIAFRCNSSI